MRTLAIANEKGGSARSSTTVSVAGVLAERGERVLVVDLDPQAAATRWLGHEPADGDGLAEVFTSRARLTTLAVPSEVDGLDVVPADEWLAAADRELDAVHVANRLARAVAEAAAGGPWSWLLLDTPPNLSVLTIAATVAADWTVVPCGVSSIDLAGVVRVTRRVQELAELGPPFDRAAPIAAYVPCRVKSGTSVGGEVLEDLRTTFGADRVTPPVRDTVRMVEAPSYALPITHYAPTHPVADDYRAVTDALVRLTEAAR